MINKSELWKLRALTGKMETDKALHTLEGILKGIYIDEKINKYEIIELTAWCASYMELIDIHPFSELIPLIEKYLEDGELTADEIEDLKWFIKNLTTKNLYFDLITSDIQRLEGIIHGILADNEINDKEIQTLKNWMYENDHLIGIYPFDEIESTLIGIAEDGVVSEEERKYLKVFLSQFIDYSNSMTIDKNELEKLKNKIKLSGVCTINPDVETKDKCFCFTGISKKVNRDQLENIIIEKGGKYNNNVVNHTDYLIVGANGNPLWAFSCYGRKVEKAMEMRKEGKKNKYNK